MLQRSYGRVWIAAAAFAVASGGAVAAKTCADPQAACGGLISASCLSRVGAGSLAADAPPDCAGQFDAYRSCLAEIAVACDQNAAAPATPPIAPRAVSASPPVGHRVVAEIDAAAGRFLFVVAPTPMTWSAAEQAAATMGGRLAVVDSAEKQETIAATLSRRPELFNRVQVLFNGWFYGPWIGAYQRAGAADPAAGWLWSLDPTTGASAPVLGGNWAPGEPNDFGGAEGYAIFFCIDQPTCDTWADAPLDAPVLSYIVETPR